MACRNFNWISWPILGAGLALWICGAQPTPAQSTDVVLTETQNGSTIEMSKNQRLEIRLPVQGGAGFSWGLARAPSAPVRFINSATEPVPGGNIPGGPQTEIFKFEPTAAGSGDIELGYRRPWEKDTQPARTFVVHVVVR
jgi:inhibitor of cysteine peptidase